MNGHAVSHMVKDKTSKDLSEVVVNHDATDSKTVASVDLLELERNLKAYTEEES